MSTTPSSSATTATPAASGTVLQILFSVAFVHLLNDCVQAVLPSIYPLLKQEFALSFTQVGLITLTFQCTASLLQPWIGLYTDKHPIPFLLPVGMCVTLAGVGLLSVAGSFGMLLLAAGMIGVGSSTFHPEASRVARLASGGSSASRSRCSRSAATSAPHSGRCWPPPSSSAAARAASPGSRCSCWWP